MKKSDIEKLYESPIGITFKHQPLYVGDVYKNNLGVMGIVIAKEIDEGKIQYLYKKTNKCEHILPADKAGMANSEYVANVIQDEELMNTFIANGIIIDDTKEKEIKMAKTEKAVIIPPPVEEQKQEKPVKAKRKTVIEEPQQNKPAEVEKPIETKKMNIYEKINAIRVEWSKSNIEKAGKGRAGGGAKYEYYKPQQIIDFCLAQEVKYHLYSKFSVLEDKCYYEITDLDNLEMQEVVTCPFDIPRKMAASEAQQVGAAMTYHNRRLAMMMYKIEDNSKESVDVLENADYSEPLEIPAPPTIPPVPVIMPPTTEEKAKTVVPPIPQTHVQAEAVNKPVAENNIEKEQTIEPPKKDVKAENLAGENKQKEKVAPPKNVFGKEIIPEPPKTVTPPPMTSVAPPSPATEKPIEQPKKKSIESLY